MRQLHIALTVDARRRVDVGHGVDDEIFRLRLPFAVFGGQLARELTVAVRVVERIALVLPQHRELGAIDGQQFLGGDAQHDRDDGIDLTRAWRRSAARRSGLTTASSG